MKAGWMIIFITAGVALTATFGPVISSPFRGREYFLAFVGLPIAAVAVGVGIALVVLGCVMAGHIKIR